MSKSVLTVGGSAGAWLRAGGQTVADVVNGGLVWIVAIVEAIYRAADLHLRCGVGVEAVDKFLPDERGPDVRVIASHVRQDKLRDDVVVAITDHGPERAETHVEVRRGLALHVPHGLVGLDLLVN